MKKNYIQPKAELAYSHIDVVMDETSFNTSGLPTGSEPVIDDDIPGGGTIDIKPRENTDYIEQPERMSLW